MPETMATKVLLYISLKPDGLYRTNSVLNAQEVVIGEAADSNYVTLPTVTVWAHSYRMMRRKTVNDQAS